MSYSCPPELSKEAVVALVKELFPFTEVGESSVKQLDGYEDRNVYFEGRMTGEEDGTRQFVLKIFNSCTTYELAEGINAVMKYLKGRGFICPVPVKARNGSDLLSISEESLSVASRRTRKLSFCVYVLTYIPGEVMSSIRPSPRLLYSVGRHIGNIDTALQVTRPLLRVVLSSIANGLPMGLGILSHFVPLVGNHGQEFAHPVIDTREFSDPVWDMRYFLLLKKYLPSIDNPKKRKILETATTHFKKHVIPKLPSMKCGIIHGDAHTDNIIITERNEIAGVIDFGDCINTCYIFELAVLLAATMRREVNNPAVQDPIQLVCPLISGYVHAFPLGQQELDCLYYLVLARLSLLAVVTEHNYNQQEEVNLYLCKIIDSAWRMAEKFLKISKEEVDRIWTDAMKKTADDFGL